MIATHSRLRQTDRAVRSVLDGSGDVAVRVTVVCHNLPQEEIAASLQASTLADPRVRLLEHRDGVRSPSGPFTAGLDAATAPWVSIMGSDDRLASGALPSWLAVAQRTGAEVVLAEVRLDGATVPTPPTRVRPGRHLRRTGRLDLVHDRLSYRSAPLGLLSRAAIRRTGARLLPGAATGEDIPFTTRLLAGASVALATGTPYLVGTDASDRTTEVRRPVVDELAGITGLLADPWFGSLPAQQRAAVATKLLRVHVFGMVAHRPDPTWWTAAEREELAGVAAQLVAAAGGAGALSLADHDLLGAILDVDRPAEEMIALGYARRRFGTPRTLVPRNWRRALDPEAPARFMVSSAAARFLR